MPLLVSCPKCRLEGELPDEELGGLVRCPGCGVEFPPVAAAPPVSLTSQLSDGLSVWVGASATHTPPPIRGLDSNSLPAVRPPVVLPPPPVEAPTVEVTAENAAEHVDWVRAEVRRFHAHVANQFDLIRQRREELATIEARTAATAVTRDMELNRQKADLRARTAALEQREAELADERAELGRRADKLARLEEALQRRLDEADDLEQTLRGELEEREAEVERQRKAVEEALRELRARGAAIVMVAPPEGDAGGHCCG